MHEMVEKESSAAATQRLLQKLTLTLRVQRLYVPQIYVIGVTHLLCSTHHTTQILQSCFTLLRAYRAVYRLVDVHQN